MFIPESRVLKIVSEILEVLISAETELKSYGHSYATLLLSPYDLCGIKF